MRSLKSAAMLIVGLTLLHAATFSEHLFAQQSHTQPPYTQPSYAQPDAVPLSQFTPLSVEEPRVLPPSATVEARPLTPTYPPPPLAPQSPSPTARHPQPPVNFRLASAEEPLGPQAARPLPLAPRGESSRPLTSASPKPLAPSSAGPVSTVACSLAAVLALFLIVVWCTRRLAPPGSAILPSQAVELLGRAPLGARQQMQLLRIGNKLLLVAHSAVGVETLTEIADPVEVEHLTSLCRRGRPGSASAAFNQALAQISAEPAPPGFIGPPRTTQRGVR